jgi:DNA-binding NarL/FixJ family response regulator
LSVARTLAAEQRHRMSGIRVLVVDQERIVAQAIARSLDTEPEFAVVGLASSTTEAVHATLALRPDVIVLDEGVAEPSLRDVAERLRHANPLVKLVVTSTESDPTVACECVRAGASALVTKVADLDEMVRAVRGAANGETWIPPRLLTAVLVELQTAHDLPGEDVRLRRLTDRERQVLACMMAGLDRARIASEMILSINTVRTHTQNILSKLEVHSSLEAVGLALQLGFQSPVHAA